MLFHAEGGELDSHSIVSPPVMVSGFLLYRRSGGQSGLDVEPTRIIDSEMAKVLRSIDGALNSWTAPCTKAGPPIQGFKKNP
jgi:hypothetical protein